MAKRKAASKGTDKTKQSDSAPAIVDPRITRTLYVGLWCLPASSEFSVSPEDIKTVTECVETDDMGAIETLTFIRWIQCTRVFHALPNRDTGLARRWREVKDIVVSELPDDLRRSLLATGFSHEQFVTAYLDTPDPQGGSTERKALYLTPEWERWALDNGLHPRSIRQEVSAGEENANTAGSDATIEKKQRKKKGKKLGRKTGYFLRRHCVKACVDKDYSPSEIETAFNKYTEDLLFDNKIVPKELDEITYDKIKHDMDWVSENKLPALKKGGNKAEFIAFQNWLKDYDTKRTT